MKLSDLPSETFPIPFGASAGDGFIRQVPIVSQIGITDGAASLTDGFPPLNFQPVGAGGVPPFGQDMNGIINQITQWTQWQNAGGQVTFNLAFVTAIGGYPQGALLKSTVTAGVLWLNTVDDNTTNPDSNGVGWIALSTTATTPIIAQSNVTLYVRTDGNDNNNGSANTAASAFLTIAAAINYGISRFFFGGFSLTIQLGIAGTYAAPGSIFAPVLVSIVGNTASQSTYIISGTGPAGGSAAMVGSAGLNVTLSGVTLANTGNINHSAAALGGSISVDHVTFTASVATTFSAMTAVTGSLTIGAGCIVSGGSWGAAFSASSGGGLNISSNVTFSSTPAFSSACAVASILGNIRTSSSPSISGSATGARYLSILNSVIQTNGGGANFFPGNAAGSTSTGGQYA